MHRRELEVLLKTAEKHRVALQRSWQKAEDLEAAIQAAQRTYTDVRAKRKENNGSKIKPS
jgi:hypothetical protein